MSPGRDTVRTTGLLFADEDEEAWFARVFELSQVAQETRALRHGLLRRARTHVERHASVPGAFAWLSEAVVVGGLPSGARLALHPDAPGVFLLPVGEIAIGAVTERMVTPVAPSLVRYVADVLGDPMAHVVAEWRHRADGRPWCVDAVA